MKTLSYFWVLYLLLVAAPYWTASGSDPVDSLRAP